MPDFELITYATCEDCGWRGPASDLLDVCGTCESDVTLDEDGNCDCGAEDAAQPWMCPACFSRRTNVEE